MRSNARYIGLAMLRFIYDHVLP